MLTDTAEDPLVKKTKQNEKLARRAYLNRINPPPMYLCFSLGSMAQVLVGEHRQPPHPSHPHLRDDVALSSLGRRHHTRTQCRVSRNRAWRFAEAPPSPCQLCWAGWSPRTLGWIPAMASFLQASALFLEHPERGLHCLPLVRAAVPEPSAPREHHVGFTRTRTGMGWSLQHPGRHDVLLALIPTH